LEFYLQKACKTIEIQNPLVLLAHVSNFFILKQLKGTITCKILVKNVWPVNFIAYNVNETLEFFTYRHGEQ